MRCSTSQWSFSSPSAMRFPSRRSATTVRPSTLETGGAAVRKTNGLPSRTRCNGWPRIRASSANKYTVMSGNSGTAGNVTETGIAVWCF